MFIFLFILQTPYIQITIHLKAFFSLIRTNIIVYFTTLENYFYEINMKVNALGNSLLLEEAWSSLLGIGDHQGNIAQTFPKCFTHVMMYISKAVCRKYRPHVRLSSCLAWITHLRLSFCISIAVCLLFPRYV